MKLSLLLFEAALLSSFVSTWVKAFCWDQCETVPSWVCRTGNACSTCGADSCSALCAKCPFSVYAGADCSCSEPVWEGDCFADQIGPDDELTAQLDWYNRVDSFEFADRRAYLFNRQLFAPLSSDDNNMIAGVLYTLTESTKTLKMTILFPPLYPIESLEARVTVNNENGERVRSETCFIQQHSWHCHARIRSRFLEATNSYTYTIEYQPNPFDASLVYTLEGKIPQQVGFPKVAALGCFGRDDTTDKQKLADALLAEEPDVIVLQGDQTYFHQNLLYGFFETVYSLRDVLKDVPTIVQLDDHDYGTGNLWGAENMEEDSGVGFPKAPCIVNMKQDLAMGHLPDSASTSTLQTGITVHYTNLVWGEVDFAILEARKFKSYSSGGTILGSEQEAWLSQYCSDSSKVKVVLSQTPFSNLATDYYYTGGKLTSNEERSALDSNGYPVPGRVSALSILENCGSTDVVVLSGDIHMTAAVYYDDYGISECSSAAAVNDVFWRLTSYEKNKVSQDVFGNTLRLLDVYNVDDGIMDKYISPGSTRAASDEDKHLRGDGFLVFTSGAMTCTARGYRTGSEVFWEVTVPPPNVPVEAGTPSPTSSPDPEEPALCWEDSCLVSKFYKWLCPMQFGCEACPDKDAVCQRLCEGCSEGQPMGGVDCDCSSLPPPPPPPLPAPDCFGQCDAESDAKWVCGFTEFGCEGCSDPVDVCKKLCDRCDKIGNIDAIEKIAGLECDCTCWEECNADSGSDWVCGFSNWGCHACNNPDEVCPKLCNRCGKTGSAEIFAGLECDCS